MLAACASSTLAASYFLVAPVRAGASTADAVSVALQSTALPEGKLNKAYSFDLKPYLTVSGDPAFSADAVTWSAVGLPAGLTLTGGVLSGTPTSLVPDTSVSVTASYKTAEGQQVYSIKVGENVFQVLHVANTNGRACAVTLAGGVMCWGSNGNGATVFQAVAGLSSGVSKVYLSGNAAHACALLSTGGLKCWGNNDYGQLGNGTLVSSATPVQVAGLESGVVEVSLGVSHSCAVTTAGEAKCWGHNWAGQLGDNSMVDRATPVTVSGLTSGVTSISVRFASSCAVVSGAARCWGSGAEGQLGNGFTSNRLVPTAVTGLTTGVVSISGTYQSVCALINDGSLKCWGSNWAGQLGVPSSTRILTPVTATVPGIAAASISVGNEHACLVSPAGQLKCWGSTQYRASGMPTGGQAGGTPAGMASGVLSVSASNQTTCAITTGNVLSCWGWNSSASLGVGTANLIVNTPMKVLSP